MSSSIVCAVLLNSIGIPDAEQNMNAARGFTNPASTILYFD